MTGRSQSLTTGQGTEQDLPAEVQVGTTRPATFGNHLPLVLIAGPCAMESAGHAFEMAASLREIAETAQLGLVFKTSFDKANRTAAAGRRGLGLEEALPVFAEIRAKLGIPVTTDVHE